MAVAIATRQPSRPSRARSIRKKALVYAGLTFYAVLAGLPVYWMLITTFKPDQDLYNLNAFPLFFNQHGVTLDHLALLFYKTGFTTWIKNTFVVSAAVVLITLAVSVPAGYALARLRFRGAETLTIGIFMTYLVPTTLLFLPLVKVFFWGSLMAGALIAGIPVAILYSFFLDYFVRGITGGAVK